MPAPSITSSCCTLMLRRMCQRPTHTHTSQLSVRRRPAWSPTRMSHSILFISPLLLFTSAIHQYSRAGYGLFTGDYCGVHPHDRGACAHPPLYPVLWHRYNLALRLRIAPLLSSSVAEYINAAYIAGLLKRTDRYLI